LSFSCLLPLKHYLSDNLKGMESNILSSGVGKLNIYF
jgi:hypothetical protein